MVALIYVVAIGCAWLFITNAALIREARLENRFFALFLILMTVGFLANSYVIFIVVATISILALSAGPPVRRIATFLFLFPLLPTLNVPISFAGFQIIVMSWQRFLALILLFPLLMGAFRARPILHHPADKFLIAYLLLDAALGFRDVSLTAGLRNIVYSFIDIVAPYYVLSRYLTTIADLRYALTAFLATLVFAGLTNVFESLNAWHVLEELERSITGIVQTFNTTRAGMLRAFGSFDTPGASAFALAAGIGVLWAVLPNLRGRRALLLFGILALGLMATFSRGSWVAAGIIGIGYATTTNFKQFARLFALALVALVVLGMSEIGDDIFGMLPFVGEVSGEAARSANYRGQLFEVAVQVANETPLFGSTTFHLRPEMDAIRQPDGLLDLANHYLLVLLNSGYLGLISFASIFVFAIAKLKGSLKSPTGTSAAQQHVSRALLFTLAGLLFALISISALGTVGLILWCLLGLASRATDASPSDQKSAATPPY